MAMLEISTHFGNADVRVTKVEDHIDHMMVVGKDCCGGKEIRVAISVALLDRLIAERTATTDRIAEQYKPEDFAGYPTPTKRTKRSR